MKTDSVRRQSIFDEQIRLFMEVEFTDEANAVYDRQLRVWGLDVQKRYRSMLFFLIPRY